MRKTMKKLTQGATRLLVLALGLGLVSTGWAATQVAVWDGDFTATQTGYTLDLNGNTLSQDNSTITISGTEGVKVDVSSATLSGQITVLFKYSDLNVSLGSEQTMVTAAISGNNNRAGIHLTTSAQTSGLEGGSTINNSTNGGTASPRETLTAAQSSGLMAFTYTKPGVYLYHIQNGERTTLYGWGGLGSSSSWNFTGVCVGGNRGSATNGGPATGMKITAIAVFSGVMTQAEMCAYAFPSDDPTAGYDYAATISSNTDLSEITTWTKGSGTPGTDSKVYIKIENNAVLTISSSVDYGVLFVNGGSITLADGASIGSTRVMGSQINVTSAATATITGSTMLSAISCGNNSTLNIEDSTIDGGLLAPQSGNVTINTYGTVAFGSSADNDFKYSTTFNVESGTTTYNSSGDKKLWCNINVKQGATLINERQDSFKWDADPNYPIHAHIYGRLTMNAKWTVGNNANKIHLYDGALIDGSASNAIHFNTGIGYIIAETGASVITAPVVKGNGTIAVETKAGTTLSTVSTPAIATRTGDGKLLRRVQDVRWGGGAPSADYDGVERYSSTSGGTANGNTETFLNSGLTGIFKVTTENGGYVILGWVGSGSFNNPIFSGRPTLWANGDIRIFHATSDKPFTVNNLSGSGYLKNGNTAGNDSNVNKLIDTLQTEDTTYNGVFPASEKAVGDPALTVRGDSELHSLTLTGASNTTGPLTIEDKAKVVFSSTGKWSGGTVTVKNGGVLESQNTAAIAANLKVEEGATLKFASGVELLASNYDWTSVSTEGSVKVDLSAITPSATPVTLIASGVEVTSDKFTVTAAQRTATLSVDDGALKATFSNYWRDGDWSGSVVDDDDATLYISQNSTLTVSVAMSLGTVTVVKEGEGNVVLTISGAGALTTGGWTIPEGVTVNTPASMSISGTVSGGGVINVPANATLAMNGVTCSAKVTVSGTLETSGDTTLSAANTSAAGSLIHIVSDIASVRFDYSAASGDITIDAGAELLLTGSAGYCWSPFPTSATTCIDVSGTLNIGDGTLYMYANATLKLRSGALIKGSGGYPSSSYGAILWYNTAPLYVYGNAEICAKINTRSGTSPIFNVDEDATLAITEAFIPQNGSDGGGSITKAGAGTLKLSNVSMTKPIHGSEGTVWLDAAGTKLVHTATGSTFSGVLKLTNTGSTQNNFEPSSATCFTDDARPEFILNSSDTYFNTYYNNKKFYVSNFSGSGNFKANYTTGPLTYTINTKQTKDTEFSGVFNSEGTRASCLEVVGAGSAPVHTLTLSGVNTTTNTLTVSDYGKVVFSNTGSWANGVVRVGANGVLESQHDANVAGSLVLEASSVLAYGNSSETIKASGAFTPPVSGKVTVDVSNLTIAANASKDLLTVGSGTMNANKFSLVGNTETHVLSASGQTLSLVPIAATVTSSSGTTSYATLNEAIGGLWGYSSSNPDAYVTLVNATTSDLTTISAEDLASAGIVYDESDGTYGFAAAEISSAKYTTVAKAIAAAASSGDTVTLLRNTSAQNISLGGKSITLDEDGNTFSGSFTSSGTLILGAPLAAADPARWAESWTGTVELKDITTVITDFDFADYGNANSTVRANNVLVRMPETGGEYGNVREINLVGEGLRFGGDPIAGLDFTFSAAISGTGKIRVGTRCQTASPAHTRYIFKGDLSDFGGGVDYNDTGWYKATIVFQDGTDEIPAGNNGEWGQIILTENTTISLGGEMYGPAGIIVAGSINVLDGGSVRVDSGSGQKIEGSGTITYTAFPASAPAFNNSWAGEVHLPGNASITGTNFGNWGKSGSKIVLDGDIAGWIAQNTSVSAEMVLDGHSLTVNDFSPSSYSFSKISGSGNISFNHKENGYQPSSLTIGEIAPTYSGTVNNNTTATLNINTIALAGGASVAAGTKLLKVGGTGSFSVGSVTVGGATQSGLQLAYASDGVYVACASYGGDGYISVSAAIDAAVADGGDVSTITILDGSTTLPAGYEQYYIDNGTICKYQAAVIDASNSVHYYATAQAAVSAIDTYTTSPYYDHFEVYCGTDVAVSVNTSDFAWNVYDVKIKCLNGATVVVSSSSVEYEFSASEPDEDSVVTYSKSEKATTYVWAGTGESPLSWGNNNKWKVGTSEGDTAARAPSTLDTVVINGGAPISIGGVTVATMQVGGAATISGSGTLTATGNVVLTDAAARLTVSGVTLSPTPTTTVANSYVKLTGSTYSVDTYKTVTFAGSNFSFAVTTNSQAVAVANNACTVEAGAISFTITPSSGYHVTAVTPSSGSVSGEGPYAYTVSGDATITVTTALDSSVAIGEATFVYGVDYTNATVTVAVTETNASGVEYTLTIGDKNYTANAVGGTTVTFNDVEVPRGAAYGTVNYTITSDATTTTGGGAREAAVADVAADWINENATTHGLASAGGSWTNAEAVTYSDGKATITDNRFEATTASTASRVVLKFNVCFSSTSEEDVSGEAQAAIKLGEENDATTFKVLTTGNAWMPVSRAGFTPDASATYNVVLTIDYGTGTYKVDVAGNSMTNSTGSASFPLAASRTSVQNIDFAGSGTLTSLKGDQLEGYMVKDGQNHYYATIEAATQAYNSANAPYTVLHNGTAPSGWKIVEGALIKVAKGLFFMAY